MTAWRGEVRTCACGTIFSPKREKQRHCSTRCRVADAVNRHRSDYTEADPTQLPEKRLQGLSDSPSAFSDGPTMVWPDDRTEHLEHGSNPDGSTPGALQGDDYPLTYDGSGYPELPACLDRRPKPECLAEAA